MDNTRYDGSVLLGEIHIVETKEGQFNVKSHTFEPEEIVAVMYTVLYAFLDQLIDAQPSDDYDVMMSDIGKVIFRLIEDKNRLIEENQDLKSKMKN